jgi:hypothetical protein
LQVGRVRCGLVEFGILESLAPARSQPQQPAIHLADQLLALLLGAPRDSDAARGGARARECLDQAPCTSLSRSGAYRDRTGDLRLAKPALSQLS